MSILGITKRERLQQWFLIEPVPSSELSYFGHSHLLFLFVNMNIQKKSRATRALSFLFLHLLFVFFLGIVVFIHELVIRESLDSAKIRSLADAKV